ncbi:MAG: DNA mismatch repair protein MutS [Candidatus Dojkabacteria bacterium]|nr:MAG: DNA mismatch repair protein MutS [Candidatus Dojkabacteria bacterium]
MTPAMQQYLKIKSEYPDHIVLFRMGDFYETFYDDAKKASVILGITLTARDREKKIPMAGIPFHSLDTYLNRLIENNEKVVLVEQLEDPKKAVGVVKRGIVRIFTPGTTFDTETKQNNYLFSIYKHKQTFDCAFADLSEGIIFIIQFDNFNDLLSNLIITLPKEIITVRSSFTDPQLHSIKAHLKKTLLSELNENYFSEKWYEEKITPILKDKLLHLESHSVNGLLNYFVETQRTDLGHINEVKIFGLKDFMKLDANAIASLEIFEGQRQDAVPLIRVIDHTVTHGGAKLLRKWLASPLVNVEKIKQRQSQVFAIKNLGQEIILKHQQKLAEIHDLNRIATKIGLKTANARDLRNLVDSTKTIFEFISDLKKYENLDAIVEKLDRIEKEIKISQDILALIHKTIVDAPPLSIREGNMIRAGVSKELDELHDIKTGSSEWLRTFEQQEIKKTNISTLKVRYNKVFGFYIEVSKGQSKNVPSNYIRKQTLVNAERYITPELKEYEAKFLSAEDRINALEYEIFTDLLEKASQLIIPIQNIYQIIAELDVIYALALTAIMNHWTLPLVNDGFAIKIENGRHPVVEHILLKQGKLFVKNSYVADENATLTIITGPNMGGKSTYLRQVALIVLLAQIGSYVPADQAEIGVVDQIFTRIGASDNLSMGESTFMVEMLETSSILNNATKQSLVILDEIGRGTSTFDGMSIAWAVCEYLASKGCKTLFATHYHELTDLADKYPTIKNLCVKVTEYEGEIIFLHQIVPGRVDKSYGIHVAKLAGIPNKVITTAQKILHILERQKDRLQPKPYDLFSGAENKDDESINQDFIHVDKIIDILEKIEINTISPLEALHLLQQLQDMVKNK